MTTPEPLASSLARLQQRAPGPQGVTTPPETETPPFELQLAARAGVPRRFADAVIPDEVSVISTTDTHPDVIAARSYLKWEADGMKRNVVIAGPVGTGKTHLAIAMARAAFTPWLFAPVIEALDAMRPGGDEKIGPTRLQGVGLLVLDDLGSERSTDWTMDRLYAIVNRRWMEERTTIVTTNLRLGTGVAGDPGYLVTAIGERLYSRLVDGAIGVTLTGEDRRRNRA